jgi:L-seryl-tRNA(Ser) seleniumtransferase
LRRLPKVDDLMNAPALKILFETFPRRVVVDAVRASIDAARIEIESVSEPADAQHLVEVAVLADDTARLVAAIMRPSLRRLVNATGVVVHTNLGRSILPKAAVAAVMEVASGYSNTEFDVENGKRGSRHDHIEKLLCRLTGAEAAMVVNNNAAAVLLALSALAKGKEVIISRGQLVEIGGSFRIPDVMRQSGAKLMEVGSTNKTRIEDFKSAISGKTGLIMRAHPSNYQVVGFSAEVGLKDLVSLARQNELPVLDDLGSGVLIDLEAAGLPHEPTVQESVAAAVDITTFSGDKLLGGPQAGIIVGSKRYVDKLKKHPLARAVRIDKMTLAALEAVLRIYYDEEQAVKEIPTLGMLYADNQELADRAKALAADLTKALSSMAEVSAELDTSKVGGGALPLTEMSTAVVALKPLRGSVNALEKAFRRSSIPIIGRIQDKRLLFDLRTIQPDEEDTIVEAASHVASNQ